MSCIEGSNPSASANPKAKTGPLGPFFICFYQSFSSLGAAKVVLSSLTSSR
jgi:hypothetical protein